MLVSGSLSSLLQSALSLDGMYSKWAFLVALLAGWRWLRLGSEPMRGALLTLSLFYVAVANVAPQYSVWGVPFFSSWRGPQRTARGSRRGWRHTMPDSLSCISRLQRATFISRIRALIIA